MGNDPVMATQIMHGSDIEEHRFLFALKLDVKAVGGKTVLVAAFIDHYHDRIKAFHVKDAEFRPDGKSGAYGGYMPWSKRAGRFRSPGDGQVDFGGIFTKLSTYGFDGWATLEWECFIKNPEDGAREGAQFITDHIIKVSDRAFDDFVKSGADRNANRAMLGLEE